MSKQVKRVKFANNNYGLIWLDVDSSTWMIVDACGAGRHLVNRACRLADRGMTLEYREGARYVKINAHIDMMG